MWSPPHALQEIGEPIALLAEVEYLRIIFAKGVSAPRVFYLLLAGATALEREELTLPDSAAVAVCTKAGESLQREDVPSRAKAFGQLREHLRRARAHLEPRE